MPRSLHEAQRGTCPRDCPSAMSAAAVWAGFAPASTALASKRAAVAPLSAPHAGLVPRDLPRRRAAADRARRPRSRGLVQALPRRRAAVRLARRDVVPAGQPLPPARLHDAAGAHSRDAAPQRRLRDAVQPTLRPRRAPVPGTLRESGRRGRRVLRGRSGVRLRELDARWPPRLALAGTRLRGHGRTGLCLAEG